MPARADAARKKWPSQSPNLILWVLGSEQPRARPAGNGKVIRNTCVRAISCDSDDLKERECARERGPKRRQTRRVHVTQAFVCLVQPCTRFTGSE